MCIYFHSDDLTFLIAPATQLDERVSKMNEWMNEFSSVIVSLHEATPPKVMAESILW